MVANAWHHRSDALSSVAVLIGVTAAYVNPAWHKADAYAALAVCVFILKVGIRLSWEATKEVVDTAPDPAMIERFRTMASRVDGVRGVHDLRARYSGADILIEVHIEVDPDLSVQAGHEIASRVKYGLEDGFTEVKRVIVHVDPSREG